MITKRIDKIIAREGLIIIGLGIVLYFSTSFLCQHISAIFPKYRIEFTNGKAYTIDIYPDYYYSKNSKQELREFFHPNGKVIQKRINEVIKRENIDSSLKETKLINSKQLYFSEQLFNLLSLGLFIKVIIIYLLLALIRFIIWAIAALKKK